MSEHVSQQVSEYIRVRMSARVRAHACREGCGSHGARRGTRGRSARWRLSRCHSHSPIMQLQPRPIVDCSLGGIVNSQSCLRSHFNSFSRRLTASVSVRKSSTEVCSVQALVHMILAHARAHVHSGMQARMCAQAFVRAHTHCVAQHVLCLEVIVRQAGAQKRERRLERCLDNGHD